MAGRTRLELRYTLPEEHPRPHLYPCLNGRILKLIEYSVGPERDVHEPMTMPEEQR